MGVKYLLFKKKIMFESQLIKLTTESSAKHKVDNIGAHVFAPE